jgi:repressor LexA
MSTREQGPAQPKNMIEEDDDSEDVLPALTERQLEVLVYIEHCIDDHLPPTRAEIAKHFGMKSPNAADEIVQRLALKGRITIMRDIPRGIKLVEP